MKRDRTQNTDVSEANFQVVLSYEIIKLYAYELKTQFMNVVF